MKPAGTTAASTAFCAEKIEGPGGFLWIDGNGKITAGNGTLDDPKPNAFSLVQIQDCPGSTEICRASCYVHGLEKHAPDVHAIYQHNSQMIRQVVFGPDADEWATVMSSWINKNCRGGFRWHVSGDVWSMQYAAWIAKVCMLAPEIKFWIYTRSFDFLPPLAAISTNRGGNLSVNLSCDWDNYIAAMNMHMLTGLRLCYLTSDGHVPGYLGDDGVIFPDYRLRGGTEAGQAWFADLMPQQKAMVCPVDYHGKSEQRRCGPCSRCLK